MEVLELFLSAVMAAAFCLSPSLVHAQDQSGFISIDCGITEGSSYNDKITGLRYISDENYTDAGVNKDISPKINKTDIDKQYLNLRSFPDGNKICYTLKPLRSKNKYLIRAGFLYGNYDELDDVPRFDLYLGINWWATVTLTDASTLFRIEIVHLLSSDSIDICLVNTGFGTPFISVLELRLLDDRTHSNVSQLVVGSFGCGLALSDSIRFSVDVYDRIWLPFRLQEWEVKHTSYAIESPDDDKNGVPNAIMQGAAVPINRSDAIVFYFSRDDPTTQFFFYMHFAEIENLPENQTREFNIYVNKTLWSGPIVPKYLQRTTVSSVSPLKGTYFTVSINKTINSTLPPLLNAMELYLVHELLQAETYEDDVHAVMNIKSYYKVKRYWQGDPCGPKTARWQGVNCSYDAYDPPRITSLDLSSSGLTGEISPDIFNLKMIQYLDLSNNSLRGSIPHFLSQLPYLRVLNLSENELSGSVPSELNERSKNGTLILKLVLRYFGSVRGEIKVLTITTNFRRILGEGQFARLYHGYVDRTQVAVKIFSPSVAQAYKQFSDDAKLLTRVHHRNLVTCFGYCDEDSNRALIFEHMINGNLEHILLDRNANILSWQERLQIAKDVAQGLQYLHDGCRPPIIHGNLKPANILLNENFLAKLADFGLSKILTIEGSTKEYIDPDTLLGRGEIKGIVDSRLQGDYLLDSVWKAVELAMACASRASIKRPAMTQAVMALNHCLAMEISRVNRSEGTIEMVSVNLGTGVVPQAR
ncbi:INSENSITIVE 1-ASSOCIATED RECEPTOR KINASE 1 putative-RELATED [Salix koriyanagi]|uniref:non-specific serine/threonine protein kinase n=1 Tax=Salix koriyanagi TaxID=2511006 RepID=A0A9Q0PY63_9ROSI|nr:INSENSITIVE 1-ASSOCIATED RECEPTOR KINASE 1 putative-RELATED [Salix koriyanagi]